MSRTLIALRRISSGPEPFQGGRRDVPGSCVGEEPRERMVFFRGGRRVSHQWPRSFFSKMRTRLFSFLIRTTLLRRRFQEGQPCSCTCGLSGLW